MQKGDDPKEFELRALRRAAKEAGLPPAERDKFANANADGDFKFDIGDPTPKDDNRARIKDFTILIGKAVPYKLSDNQVADLKQRLERSGKMPSGQETAPQRKPRSPTAIHQKTALIAPTLNGQSLIAYCVKRKFCP